MVYGTGTRIGHPGGHFCRHLSPEEMENDISGVSVTDSKLREKFESLDANHNGWLDRSEIIKLYKDQEDYGLPVTDREIESMLRRYCFKSADDTKVTFEEFSVLWLHLAQR